MRIAEFLFGWLGTKYDNELEVVSTKPDPGKVRLAVQAGQEESNLGSVSGNIRRADGEHEEYAYTMFRLTADKQAGAFYIATRPRGEQDCREVFYIDNGAAIFRVPVQAPNLGHGGGGVTNKMVSSDGRFVTVQQTDGNFVTYSLELGPEGDPNAAVWSAWHGHIQR